MIVPSFAGVSSESEHRFGSLGPVLGAKRHICAFFHRPDEEYRVPFQLGLHDEVGVLAGAQSAPRQHREQPVTGSLVCHVRIAASVESVS